ncbi:MAG: AAA family ATPase [Thermoplasmataceae archaeon]|jgi:exonuclease SbcC
MLIKKIEMEDFLSHADTSLSLDRGINLIVGPNGSGKSSILDAIRFAMFGKDRTRLSNPVRNGKKKCSVRLTFNIDNDEYIITRSYGSRQQDREAFAFRNGVQEAFSQDSVTRYVETVLGMEKDVFQNSVFVGQGEIDEIVNEQPKRRKELFAKIIGIEKLESASDRMREVEAELKDRLSDMGSSIVELSLIRTKMQQLSGRLEEMKIKKKESDALFRDATEHEKSLETKYESSRKQLSELRAKADFLKKKKEDSIRISDEIQKLSKQMEGKAQVEKELEEVSKSPYLAHRDLIFDNIAEFEKIALYSREIESLSKQIKDISALMEEMESLKNQHSKFTELNERITALRSDLTNLEKSSNEYLMLSDRVSRLRDSISNIRKSVDPERSFIIELFGTDNPSKSSVRERIESTIENRRKLEERIRNMKVDLGMINTGKKEAQERAEKLAGKKTCPLCGSQLTDDHVTKLHIEISSSITEFMARAGNLATEIGKINAEIEKLDSLLERMQSSRVSAYLLSIERLNSETEELALDEKSMKSQEAQHEHYKAIRKNIAEIEEEIKKLEHIEKRFSLLESMNLTAELDSKRSRLDSETALLESALGSIADVSAKIGEEFTNETVTRLRSISRKFDELIKRRDYFSNSQALLDGRKEDLQKLSGDIASAEKELNGMDIVERECSSLEVEYRQARARSTEINADLQATIRTIEAMDDEIAGYRKKEEELSVIEKEIKNIEAAIEIAKKIRTAFGVDGIQKYLRQRASEFITNGTRQILSSFSLEFDDVEVDEDFDVRVQRSGSIDLQALSGGERIALAIALRISISRFLDEEQKMNCFLMDEPTTFLDEERRANLRNILHYALGDDILIPQVVMITHHSELISAGDTIFEVSKRNGASFVET